MKADAALVKSVESYQFILARLVNRPINQENLQYLIK